MAVTLVDVAIALVTATIIFVVVNFLRKRNSKETPRVSSWIPYVGSAIEFGKNPLQFINTYGAKLGDVFTARILGRDMTFITHPRAYDLFFKAYDDELGLREVYRFMRPVFGPNVVYDAASTELMMEQIKFVSSHFTVPRFKYFVTVFEEEVQMKVKEMGERGTCDVFQMLAKLIIFTASRCLLGNGVRQYLQNKNMAELYHDLDDGITPLSFFFPWLPSKKRDNAAANVFKIFRELIAERRKSNEQCEDVLEALMQGNYRSGEKVPDEHICGILLAGLFAGQHTSSVASSWTLMFIIANPSIYKRVMEEQEKVMDGDLNGVLTFEKVKEMDLLERCMKEALRLYPPLIMVMRYVKKAREYNGMIIPKGNILVASPAASGRHPEVFTNPDTFDPDRFAEPRKEHEKVNHAYLAFGSGRHKCIGEAFALLQVKSVLSCLLRAFKFDLVAKKLPTVSYHSLVIGPDAPRDVNYERRSSWK